MTEGNYTDGISNEREMLARIEHNNLESLYEQARNAPNGAVISRLVEPVLRAEVRAEVFDAAVTSAETAEAVLRKYLADSARHTDAFERAAQDVRREAARSALPYLKGFVDANAVL